MYENICICIHVYIHMYIYIFVYTEVDIHKCDTTNENTYPKPWRQYLKMLPNVAPA